MKIEESFMKALLTTQKKYPVLKLSPDVKVEVTGNAILGMCKEFHKAGWTDNAAPDFANLFGFGKNP